MANSTSPMVSPATVRLVTSANNREVAWLKHSGNRLCISERRVEQELTPGVYHISHSSLMAFDQPTGISVYYQINKIVF